MALLFSFIPALVYALVPLPLYLLWGHKLRRVKKALLWELKETSWPRRTWYRKWGATTFGRVIMSRPDPSEQLLTHELRHVEQFDAACVLGAMLGGIVLAFGSWVGALLVYLSAPLGAYVSAMIVAVMNGDRAYRDNHLEVAAYDHANLWDLEHGKD